MMHRRSLSALAACALLGACSDYATFVTSTDLGINLDAATQQLNIGYVRAELFHGPGYPSEGSAPSAVGYINSNLTPFAPTIKQLYATGTAAELVTQNQEPKLTPESSDKLEGQRRPFFFGTGTNFGLKVGFAGDVPSSVRLGYNREEISIIPMQRTDPASGQPDKYASVLAAINMDNTIAGAKGTSIKPTQFFATGAAARNLAKRADIREYFGLQAKTAVKNATSLEALNQILSDDTLKVKEYFAVRGGYTIRSRDDLLKAPGHYDEIPADLKAATSEDSFFTALTKYPLLASTLADHIPR